MDNTEEVRPQTAQPLDDGTAQLTPNVPAQADQQAVSAEPAKKQSGFLSTLIGGVGQIAASYIAPADPAGRVATGPQDLELGDVLAVSRVNEMYWHYAVYVGDGRVIHYAAESGDFGGKICIHEADLAQFQGDAPSFRVLEFPDSAPSTVDTKDADRTLLQSRGESWFFDLLRAGSYKLYSPEETVARARSRLGEEKYSLPVNNCEHFAIWCKTGMKESHQVNIWLSRLAKWATSAAATAVENKKKK